MMVVTHIMASVFLYSLIYSNPSGIVLAALVGGSFLPDLDIKFNHRSTLHFPIMYSLAALLTGLLSLKHVSIFFGSAALHCISEILGNDSGEYVEKDKGAVYDHLRSKWVKGLNIINQDGGPKDLIFLIALTLGTLSIANNPETLLVALFSLFSGFLYFKIRDRVEKIFPDFLLT